MEVWWKAHAWWSAKKKCVSEGVELHWKQDDGAGSEWGQGEAGNALSCHAMPRPAEGRASAEHRQDATPISAPSSGPDKRKRIVLSQRRSAFHCVSRLGDQACVCTWRLPIAGLSERCHRARARLEDATGAESRHGYLERLPRTRGIIRQRSCAPTPGIMRISTTCRRAQRPRRRAGHGFLRPDQQILRRRLSSILAPHLHCPKGKNPITSSIQLPLSGPQAPKIDDGHRQKPSANPALAHLGDQRGQDRVGGR